MRIIVHNDVWKRIQKQLPFIRIPNKRFKNKKGRFVTLQNFVIPFVEPYHYPRLHISIKKIGKYEMLLLEVHVDQSKHVDSIYSHERIDSIINLIHNS